MLEVFFLSLPVFMLMGVGALLGKMGVFGQQGEQTCLRLLVNVFLPCFIVFHVSRVEGIGSGWSLLVLVLGSALLTAAQLFLALGFGKALGLKQGDGLRSFAVSSGLLNYGFLPIPIVQGMMGSGAVLATLIVNNVGIDLAIWTVAVSLYGSVFQWRRILNMPLLALVLALALNLTGAAAGVPSWCWRFVEIASGAAIPLGIVLAGSSLGNSAQGQALRAGDFVAQWRVSLGALGLRLLLLPACLLGVMWLLRDVWPEAAWVMGIHAAMPAATMPVVLARLYGGHPRTAAIVCVGTSVVSLLSTPLYLTLVKAVME